MLVNKLNSNIAATRFGAETFKQRQSRVLSGVTKRPAPYTCHVSRAQRVTNNRKEAHGFPNEQWDVRGRYVLEFRYSGWLEVTQPSSRRAYRRAIRCIRRPRSPVKLSTSSQYASLKFSPVTNGTDLYTLDLCLFCSKNNQSIINICLFSFHLDPEIVMSFQDLIVVYIKRI